MTGTKRLLKPIYWHRSTKLRRMSLVRVGDRVSFCDNQWVIVAWNSAEDVVLIVRGVERGPFLQPFNFSISAAALGLEWGA